LLLLKSFIIIFRVNANNFEACDESSIQVYRTLSEDERCKPLRFLSTKPHVNNSLLVSFPGSGNTWVRHLIEQASGIYSGSVYGDMALYIGGKFWYDSLFVSQDNPKKS